MRITLQQVVIDMNYENAGDVLPERLLKEVKKYAAGKLLYIPFENFIEGRDIFETDVQTNLGYASLRLRKKAFRF